MWGSWIGGILLVVLGLSVYLPGLWTLPPVDRDESRFAQASRQMVESGDWIVPRVQDRPRLNKPPLAYWTQSASIAVFGDRPGQYAHGNIWVFRVPSVLAALGSVLLAWRIGLRLMPAPAAALGAAFLAVSPIVVWDAHQARADQLLLVFTTGTMYALLRVWEGRKRPGLGWPVLFWFGLAAGMLAKGPITPMIAVLTILALCWSGRDWRWVGRLRPVLGAVIVAAIVAPWVIAVGQRVGWSEYTRIILDETLGRSAAAKEGHWGPPGYHLVLLTALMWPGSMLTGLALFRGSVDTEPAAGSNAFARLVNRLRSPAADPARRFLLSWIVPAWLVFEFVSTKLPHYTMPMYPALALLSAHAVIRAGSGSLRGLNELRTRIGLAIWWIVGAGVIFGMSIVVILGGQLGWSQGGGSLAPLRQYALPGVIVLIAVLAAGRSLVRGAYLRAQLLALAAIVLWGATFLQMILPGATRFWISPRIIDAARQPDGTTATIVNQSAFKEDSLIFLARGRVRGELDRSDPLSMIVTDSGSGLRELPIEPGFTWRSAGEIRGWNYSNGRPVELFLVERRAEESQP